MSPRADLHEVAPPTLDVTASKDFTAWLADHRVSLVFTTYRDGAAYLVGLHGHGGLSIVGRGYDRTLGLTASSDTIVLSTEFQIWLLQNALANGQTAREFDKVYVPQVAYTTGDVQTHDVAVTRQGTIIFVNTLFSCLAYGSGEFSFAPAWRPPFITDLKPEDRCHMMGLAMEGGEPRYVTVAARSDEAGGWRRSVDRGGCVIDVRSNRIVVANLSLPNAPRLYRDRLWLHDSGTGYFGHADPRTGQFEPVTLCPGFPRGLCFVGRWAIAASSKLWEGRELDGLPVADNLRRFRMSARNAILVIDLETGRLAHWMRIEAGASEIYDLAVLPRVRRPAAIDLDSRDMRRVLSIAPEAPPRDPR